jgi:hypothetical protein
MLDIFVLEVVLENLLQIRFLLIKLR